MSAKRILVVDDERMLRQTIGIVLQRAGYLVDVAETGDDALEKVKERHYHLVVTDLCMPGMKGDRLAEEMKKHRPHLRVLLITANPPKEAPPQVDYVLPKPFSACEITDCVAALIETDR